MAVKINKHVFHGIYSNFGYRPFFTLDKLWADYPIHTKRAIFGAKDPDSSGSGGGTNSTPTKPPEFKDEEEALKWYKKTKYGKTEFEKLKFPEDFCKNYFTIPETEFSKYRHYFHGMIKSILFKWNYSIDYNGSHESLNDCKCSSSSSSSSSNSSSSSSEESSSQEPSSQEPSSSDYSGGQNAQLMLDILKLLDDEDLSVLLQNTGSGGSGTNTGPGDKDCCYCPPCDTPEEDKSKVKCSSTFNAKFSVDIDIDTKKFFEIPELQTRIGAIKLYRNFRPSYEDDSKTEDELYDQVGRLYKENWKLDPEWNKEFKSKKEFPDNSTRINDPVILSLGGPGGYGGGPNLSTDSNPYFSINVVLDNYKGNNPKEIISNQQKAKESNNFGKIKLQVNSKNAYFTRAGVRFYIEVSTVCYIRSQKKFMCFVEISSETDDNKYHYIEGKNPEDLQLLSPVDDYNIVPLTIFSTHDLYKKEKKDETHYPCPNGDKTGLKLKKDKLSIKIDGQTAEIEVYTPEKTEFKYKSWKTGVSKTGCENKDLDKNCSTDEYTKKWNITKPTIEFTSWKNDFSERNVFPPKVA